MKNSDPSTSSSTPVSEPAPPRQRRRRKEARPQEIIDAGLLEFGEKGFVATKLDDVAARAGIAKGTIYRYFPGKEELFMAAVMARTEAILASAAVQTGTAKDAREQIADLIRRLYEAAFESDLEVLMRIVLTEGRHFPKLGQAYHDQMINVGRTVLTRLINHGIAEGKLRDGKAARQPELVIAPLLMAVVWRMTFEPFETLDIEAFAEAHIDLVLHGLSK